MNPKLTADRLGRRAIIYIRQSGLPYSPARCYLKRKGADYPALAAPHVLCG
jgi:hypothetical protein